MDAPAKAEWKIGLHDNVSFETYLGIDAASSSRLKGGMRSWAHMKNELENPKPDTEAKRVGRIVHAGVLEPSRFKREYKAMPVYELQPKNKTAQGERSTSTQTTYVREKREAFYEKYKDRTIITKADELLATSARSAFMKFDLCRAVLDRPGPVEQTIIWEEEIGAESFQPERVLCKARPDKWLQVDGELIVLDVKTTVNAAPKPFGFWREIDKYRYDIQAAMYLAGFRAMAALGIIPNFTTSRFVLLAVEKEGIFAAHPHELHDSWVEVGDRDFRKLLKEYNACRTKGEWPLWGNEASIAHPPHYRMNEYMQED